MNESRDALRFIDRLPTQLDQRFGDRVVHQVFGQQAIAQQARELLDQSEIVTLQHRDSGRHPGGVRCTHARLSSTDDGASFGWNNPSATVDGGSGGSAPYVALIY